MFNGKLITTSNFIQEFDSLLVGDVVLLVSSSSFIKRGIVAELSERLTKKLHVKVIVCDAIRPNPELSYLSELYLKYANDQVTDVIALGGGSVMDSAKALSFLFANPAVDLVSVLKKTNNPQPSYLNLICVPTTSGTGSEVTPFATIWDKSSDTKYSLSHVVSHSVIHDASLTLGLPRDETLYSALDALSHALESIWNKQCSDVSRQYAEQAIELICLNLPVILKQPQDISTRQSLQYASYLAGLAISETKTAIAHAISYPLTLKFNMPHGLACSFTLAALVNLVGVDRLKLSPQLADSLREVFSIINFSDELAKYCTATDILTSVNGQLDSSRLDNFVLAVDDKLLHEILVNSLV